MKNTILKVATLFFAMLFVLACSRNEENVKPVASKNTEISGGNVKITLVYNVVTVWETKKSASNARESEDISVPTLQLTYNSSGALTAINLSPSASIAINPIAITPSAQISAALAGCPCAAKAVEVLNKVAAQSNVPNTGSGDFSALTAILNELVDLIDCFVAAGGCGAGDLTDVKSTADQLRTLLATLAPIPID
ncbi:MAG: hypothetical protein ACKVOU_00840, partial [Cytophagales bacterium]